MPISLGTPDVRAEYVTADPGRSLAGLPTQRLLSPGSLSVASLGRRASTGVRPRPTRCTLGQCLAREVAAECSGVPTDQEGCVRGATIALEQQALHQSAQQARFRGL